MERLFCALLLLWTGAFCKTCPTGTFSPPGSGSCQRCTVCDRTLKYEQKCTATSDAVCECVDGYTCGKNCKACPCDTIGQQRMIAGCHTCPDKTFNDRHTGECRPWKKCPGDEIREPGTKERDVVCGIGSDIPTSQPSTSLTVFSTKVSEEGSQLILIGSAFVIIILLLATCMVLAYRFLRSWIQKKFVKPFHGQLAQEVDDCTYRYPEEEEGGRCEAPSTLKGSLLEEHYPQDV